MSDDAEKAFNKYITEVFEPESTEIERFRLYRSNVRTEKKLMSKTYDMARLALKAYPDPRDVGAAADLLLSSIDMDEEDFEYEWAEHPIDYLNRLREREGVGS